MATIAEVAASAARKLSLYGVGQAFQPEDSTELTTAYNEVFAQLAAKNLTTWDLDEDIPDEYVPHLVALVAYSRLTDYPQSQKRDALIRLEESRAIPEIRELQADNVYKTPEAYYF